MLCWPVGSEGFMEIYPSRLQSPSLRNLSAPHFKHLSFHAVTVSKSASGSGFDSTFALPAKHQSWPPVILHPIDNRPLTTLDNADLTSELTIVETPMIN